MEFACWVTLTVLVMPPVETDRLPTRWTPLFGAYFAVKPVSLRFSAESQLTSELTVGVPLEELTLTSKLPLKDGTVFVSGDTVRVCALWDTPNTFVTVPDLTVTMASLGAPVVLFDAVKLNVLPVLDQVIQSGASMTVQAVPELELMVLVREPPPAGKDRVVLLIVMALASWVTLIVFVIPAVVTVKLPDRWVPLLALYFAVKPVADTSVAESQLSLGVTVGAPLVELTVTLKLPELAGTDFEVGETEKLWAVCDTMKTELALPHLTVTVSSRAAPEPMFEAVKVKVPPLLDQVIQSGQISTMQVFPQEAVMVFVREPPAGGKASSTLLIEISFFAWVTLTVFETPPVETVMVPVRDEVVVFAV